MLSYCYLIELRSQGPLIIFWWRQFISGELSRKGSQPWNASALNTKHALPQKWVNSYKYNFQIRVIESQFSSHKFCHNSYLVNCEWLFTTFTQIHHFYSILTISQIKIISTNFPILTVHLCLRSGFLFFFVVSIFPYQ